MTASRSIALAASLLACCGTLLARTPQLVTEQTIRERGTQVFTYGFFAGDEVLLEVEAVRGRSVKEVSFSRLGGATIYAGYRERHLRGRRITIPATGIYELKLRSGASGRRVYRFRIERVPGRSAPRGFSTEVVRGCLFDSSYVRVVTPVLMSVDTAVTTIWRGGKRVNSLGAAVATTTVANALGLADPTVPEIVAQLPATGGTQRTQTRTIGWSFAAATGDGGAALHRALARVNAAGTPEGGLAAIALGAEYDVPAASPGAASLGYEVYGLVGGQWSLLCEASGPVAVGRGHTVFDGPLLVRFRNGDLAEGVDVELDLVAVTATEHYRLEEREELVVHERPALLMWGEY